MNGGISHAVADGCVAVMILRDAGHETVSDCVRIDCAALVNAGNAGAAVTQFVPADSGAVARARPDSYGMADQPRLIGAEISVSQSPLQPVSHGVDKKMAARRFFPRLGNTYRSIGI